MKGRIKLKSEGRDEKMVQFADKKTGLLIGQQSGREFISDSELNG